MELKQLEYFLAVCEHGSISAAARALDARQPTLSVSLRNLEESLEATLFHRDARGIRLTPSGERLAAGAREVFTILDRTRDEVAGVEHEDVGSFTVAYADAIGAYFLPAFMRRFLESAPKIQISLRSGPKSADVRQQVIEREVDFGVGVNLEPHPDLVMVPLYRDGVEVYVSSAEREAKSFVEACLRIKRGPLILCRRSTSVDDLLARFGADEILPDRVLDCGDLQLVRSLAGEGLGAALLPRRVARHGDGNELKVLFPTLPGMPELIHLIYRADRHRTRAAMRLKDDLLEYGRSLQASDPGEQSIVPP